MDHDQLEKLQATLAELPPAQQDHLAAFLLVERLKRNKLVMPSIHQRIEDSDPANWQPWKPNPSGNHDD